MHWEQWLSLKTVRRVEYDVCERCLALFLAPPSKSAPFSPTWVSLALECGTRHPISDATPCMLWPISWMGSPLVKFSPQMCFVWPVPMFGDIWITYQHLKDRKFHIKISISGSSWEIRWYVTGPALFRAGGIPLDRGWALISTLQAGFTHLDLLGTCGLLSEQPGVNRAVEI